MTRSSIEPSDMEAGTEAPILPDEFTEPEPELGAMLEETDAALAECLERLGGVRAAEMPVAIRSELAFLQDTLKAARVDLATHYTRR